MVALVARVWHARSPLAHRIRGEEVEPDMTIELRTEDTGTTRPVRVGDHVTVRLAENPTTGYRWQPDVDGTRLALVEDRFDGPQTPRGAGGERVLTFATLLAGPVTLRLAKRRAWGDPEPIESFEVELTAQPAD